MRCLFLTLTLIATGLAVAPGADAQPFDTFEFAFPNLTFERPVALKADPSGSEWLFVLEQEGVLKTFRGLHGIEETFVVLDLTDRVLGAAHSIESGLLGLALHPAFGDNGYIFLYYLTDITGSPTARLSRFSTSGVPAVADIGSELVLVEIPREDVKHNGGDLHFSEEGYLFASFGDGACCGDPLENGQDRTNLLSTIIRIDVDNPQDGLPYGIPADNPFVGNTEGWREEIWAFGLRNPWRYSIHPETGELWVGDVGEVTYEEINRIVPGGNYGWSIMEGPECFEWPPGSGQGTNCDPEGLILPAWAYSRDVGVSVTGGYFYRGTQRVDLQGKYIFADWGTPTVWAGTLTDDGTAIDEVEVLFSGEWPHPSAFGEDADGELYFLAYFAGRIYRFIEQTNAGPPEPEPPPRSQLVLQGPNPFTDQTRLRLDMADAGTAQIVLYDALGRRVRTVLPETHLGPGEREVLISRGNLAAGTYVAQLTIDGRMVDAAKMLLMP